MHLRSLVAILTVILILSCGSKQSNQASSSDEIQDTIAAVETKIEIEHLPDTVFPSASMVDYSVTVFNDSINPVISSLDDLYADTPGAFTFRKGMQRLANFGGTVKGTPSTIDVEWTFETPFLGVWGGGTGWTGQPLYVEWPDSLVRKFKAGGAMLSEAGNREIMVGSLCGKVFFIDFVTGKASRKPIDVGNPIKGTMSLDPSLNGNLYVGQGVPDNKPFGALVIDLFKCDITHMFGEDPRAQRGWQAYDSSPLRLGQFLFRPGENGTLYKWLIGDGTLTLQSTLRYRVRGAAPGIESSMAIYRNYGYTGDNHGNILCVNLDTMKPVWCYRLGDDIDSSIVLIEEDGHPYIYTGCEIDRQNEGDGRFVKLDGLNGNEQWLLKVPGKKRIDGSKHFDGGFYCTALPGTGNCQHLLFANCVLNTDGSNGVFLAINRTNGEIVYTKPLRTYAWSSPVGFLNENQQMFVVTGDCYGNIYLINGIDGEIICRKQVGSNFESSPLVVGDEFVVGSRGEKIFKMKLK